MTNLIGQSLGRYHILEQLGEGGMATVYKAYDTRLERDVAVKVLRTEQFAPAILDRILKRFEREAKALAKLSHPNIVNVHDYGEYEGQPYLVMEYLRGGTLKDKLGKSVPWQEACRLILPVAEALAYAHEHSILHRDVKPTNILLTERGQPLLTDFGIAKILDLEGGDTLTGTGVGIGTPEYMSPEQGLGKAINASTDVYSLGVVLYELITGRKPYTADTPMAVVIKHMNDALPRPTEFVPSLPPTIENILLKALAKDSTDRFQTMGEFSAALEKAITSEATATEVGAPPKEAVTSRKDSAQETRLAQGTIDQGTIDQGTIDQGVDGEPVPARTMPPVQARAETPKPRAPQPARKKSLAWLGWLAGFSALALVICLVLVGILMGGDIIAVVFPSDTPTRTPTPTRTATRTFTTTPEYVSVAVYVFDIEGDISYWTGGLGNDWEQWMNILESDPGYRFSVTSIIDLESSTLARYQRLILPDNAIPDYYLTQVEAWLKQPGHSVIAVDSAVTYIAYSGFLWSGAKYSSGKDTYWDYDSSSSDLLMRRGPITNKVYTSSVLSSNDGDAQMYRDQLPSDAVILAESDANPSMVYAACRNIPGGGSVFVLGPFDDPGSDVYPFIRSVVYASACE